MTSGEQTTRVRGQLALGDYVKISIASFLVTAGVGGTLLVGNNVIHTAGRNNENLPASQENLVASELYESGSYLAYQQEKMTASGYHVLMAQFKLNAPSAGVFSGSYVRDYSVECNDKMNTAKTFAVAATRHAKSGSAGLVLTLRRSLGSGAILEKVSHGSSGSILVGSGFYVTAVSLSGAMHTIAGNDCMFRVYYRAKHSL